MGGMNAYPPGYTETARFAVRLERTPAHLYDDAFQEAMIALSEGGDLQAARRAIRAMKLQETRQRGGHATVNFYDWREAKLPEPVAPDPTPEAEADAKEAAVWGALAHLDPLDRNIVTLRYGLGEGDPMSAEEISRKLLLSISTVERRLRKARHIMQTVIGGA